MKNELLLLGFYHFLWKNTFITSNIHSKQSIYSNLRRQYPIYPQCRHPRVCCSFYNDVNSLHFLPTYKIAPKRTYQQAIEEKMHKFPPCLCLLFLGCSTRLNSKTFRKFPGSSQCLLFIALPNFSNCIIQWIIRIRCR